MEDLSVKALGEALLHRYECEKNSLKELHKIITDQWLPKHLEISKSEEERAAIIEECRRIIRGVLHEEGSPHGNDGTDIKDVDDPENLKDPNKIEKTLRSLRNFCFDEEPLDPRIQELLEPGRVLLSVNKALVSFQYNDGTCALRNDERYLCFVHKEKRITLWHISLETESYPYKFAMLEKVWFYRKGRTVLLSTDEVIVNAKFETIEGAAKFEQDILVAAKFCHFPILRLYGQLPAQQLLCKWCLGDTEYEQIQFRAIQTVQDEEYEDSPVNITVSEREIVDNIRRIIENFAKYAQRLLITLIIWNSGFSPIERAKPLTFDLSEDLKSLLRLIPFLNGEGFSKSLFELAEDLYSIENSLITCKMMIKCNEVLFDYFYQALDVNTYVWRLLVKYISLNDEEDKLDVLTDNADLQKEVVELMQMFCIAKEQEKSISSPRVAVVNCVDAVSEYLVKQRGSHGFPKLFDKLDQLFRAGNDVVFDVLCRNFKKEMLEAMLPLKTVSAVGKELFEERPVCLLEERPESSNFIRLSELQDRPKLNTISKRISSAIGNDELLFCMKLKGSIMIFENMLTFIESGLGFNKEQWMKLLNIRRMVADLPHNLDTDEEEEDDHDVEYVHENNITEDFSLCEDEYESILQHPSSWDKFIRNVFVESDLRPIKELSSGGYGEAVLMHHLKWKRVVLKQYHFHTDDADRKKEIDMLISLQGNQHIVRLYGFYYQSKKFIDYSLPLGIVMEYVELTLHGLIHDRKQDLFKSMYRLKTALEYVRNMASAFSSMHNLGFYHRDIKPKNILMTYEGEVRICDFGTCGHLNNTFKTGQLGTHHYKSPEMLNIYGKEIYNEKTDVYSLAVTIWELFHRRAPYLKFKGNGAITDFVCAGKRLPIEDSACPEGLKDIIQRSWAQLPSDRPTMSEIEIAASRLLSDLSEEVLGTLITGL